MEAMVVVERKGGKIIYQRKESPHGISSKELALLPAPNVDEVPRFGKKRKLQKMGLTVDGFPLEKNWDRAN